MAFGATHISTIAERRAAPGVSLTTSLLNRVGRAVVNGEYRERCFPTEADLARSHGVSRSVSREVTKMLAAKGLLGSRPRRGTFVQPDDAWNLFDPDVLRWLRTRPPTLVFATQLTELCLGIEPYAALQTARRADAELQSSLAQSLACVRDGSDDAAAESASIEFHQSVLCGAGNAFMARLCDGAALAIHVSARVLPRATGTRVDADGLARVLSCIVRRDGPGAADAMRLVLEHRMAALRTATTPLKETATRAE